MVQVPLPPAPPAPPQIPTEIIVGSGLNVEMLLVVAAAVTVVAGLVVIGPIGRAIGDALRHLFRVRRVADPQELEGLREHVAALQKRVAELEERQDFAERLLAQARERAQLPGPPRG